MASASTDPVGRRGVPWCAREEYAFGEEGCEDCRESEDEILNWHIEEKGPAYTWLDQGAEELLEDG